jgi:hypothetical protein
VVQLTATSVRPLSIVYGDCEPTAAPVVGLKDASLPDRSTAVHWLLVGQSTEIGIGWPLAVWGSTAAVPISFAVWGSKVSSLPPVSTAVHWVTDGHAIDVGIAVLIDSVVTAAAACGLKVTSLPFWSIPVHCVVDGHATPVRPVPAAWRSTGIAADQVNPVPARAAAGTISISISASVRTNPGTLKRDSVNLIAAIQSAP